MRIQVINVIILIYYNDNTCKQLNIQIRAFV